MFISSRYKTEIKMCDALLVVYSFLLAPVIAISLVFLNIYRFVVHLRLKAEYKEKFAGFLSGEDTVWSVEEPTALSVINVLAILEKDARHSNASFLESFRSMVKERISHSAHEKLLYKRRKKFGYFFWERSDEIDFERRVRWLEYERTSCDGSCDNVYNGHLKRILRNVCNQPLPDGHTASWEILVGKSCPRSRYHYLRRMEERLKNGRIRIPILFRIHHSLADGTALLKLLLDVVADKHITRVTLPRIANLSIKMRNGEEYDTITVTVPQLHRSDPRSHISNDSTTYAYQRDLLSASMPFTYLATFASIGELLQSYVLIASKYLSNTSKEQIKSEILSFLSSQWKESSDSLWNLYVKGREILNMVMIVVLAPMCLIRQGIRSMHDNSALHGAALSGHKVISYWMEDDLRNADEQKLLTKIQNIKYITGATFTDVLLAALSASLHKSFLRMECDAPRNLTVVLPRRIEEAGGTSFLKNNFSVGLLPLCISETNGTALTDPSEDSRIFERLEDVKSANAKLRRDRDYAVNYLTMKMCSVLPEELLKPLLESHSTMVLSHLPGPQEIQILGHTLKNIVFWIPNRSHTGIGCSMLSYRGYLHLSLVADRALIKDEKLLTEILENTVHEIDDLYDRLTLSSLPRKFHSTTTPTDKGSECCNDVGRK